MDRSLFVRLLEKLLDVSLVRGKHASNLLTEGRAPLATFSAKIDAAHAFGLFLARGDLEPGRFLLKGSMMDKDMPGFIGKLKTDDVPKLQAFIQGTVDAVPPKSTQ